jgi:GAF domain-containing protein
MGSDDQTHIARVLIEMGGVLHSEETVERALALITELTERTVRSASAVSVTLVGKDGAFTPNASETVARTLDQKQYDAGKGPCLEAFAERRVFNVVLKDHDDRWPALVEAAAAAGIGSSLSLPLMAGERAMGALNIYSADTRHFDEGEERTAALLAEQAGSVLGNAVAFADTTTLNGQLLDALATRDLIGQAKGILMEREGCDANEAFDILRRASQRTNHKLRDIAVQLVDSATRERKQ